MIEEIEKLAKEMEDKAGYVRVRTPHSPRKTCSSTAATCPTTPSSCTRPWSWKA